MHRLSIDASPSQLSKLRRGRRVRIRKGEGFALLVHPETFNLASKSFSKNKGVEIALSPAEISANAEQQPQSVLRPGEEDDGTSSVGATGSGLRSIFKHKGSLAKSSAKAMLADKLNDVLGTNYDYMGRAGLANAVAHKASAALSKLGINARRRLKSGLDDAMDDSSAPPSRSMAGGRLERGIVGRGGGMLHSYVPPALVSQPFGANFQMQHFLPPQYQHFNSGGSHDDSSGSGLYAGGGMYAGGGLYAGAQGRGLGCGLYA